MESVKLKDIADALGVSNVTVSNALSGKKGVSSEVREKVIKMAKEMGYDLSRYEKTGKGSKIGVIVADKYIEVGASFYWAMYQQVVYAASKKLGVTVFEVLDMDDEEKGIFPKMLLGRSVDGIIVLGCIKKEYIEKLVYQAGVPVVLLDFCVDDIPCDAVMSGNYIGMYKATRYLLDRGHRDIAFVGSVQANENIMDRFFGYKKALMESGIKLRKGWQIEDRDLVTGKLRIELPENMPTAFVCNGDLTAGMLYDILTEKGYRIPQDVSIVGYDNYLFGHSFAENLTTYNVDMKTMAEMAVKLLMGKIRGIEKRFGTRYIDSEMIERGSVKKM